jgi:hypothetical protein
MSVVSMIRNLTLAASAADTGTGNTASTFNATKAAVRLDNTFLLFFKITPPGYVHRIMPYSQTTSTENNRFHGLCVLMIQ